MYNNFQNLYEFIVDFYKLWLNNKIIIARNKLY